MAMEEASATSALSDNRLQRDIDRCRREVATAEAQLRAGDPDVQGLCLALSDWSAELRILGSMAR